MRFTKFFFNNDIKVHTIPVDLEQDIQDDLYVRYMAKSYDDYSQEEFGGEFFFDHNGCCLAVRSLETFTVDDLKVIIPSDYLLSGLSQILQASPRFVNGKTYYKLYSAMSCLILTPSQHRSLCEQIRADLDGIIERGTVDQQKLISSLNDLRRNDSFIVSKSVPEQTFEN